MSRGAKSSAPKVSLGLPVYNGENFLAEALDCLLAQTFTDFELIISDNASTDFTQSICEEYAEKDRRIKYFRQPENRGAGANYDFTFYKAQAPYFRWCTHDDLMGDDFLEACVAHLDAHPEAVGALPKDVREIDETGQFLKAIHITFGSNSANGAERFAAYTPLSRSEQFHCMPFFSLFRREALARTNLHGDYLSSDRILIAEMLLHGEIALLSTSSVSFRRHEAQYSTVSMRQDVEFAIEWFQPKNAGKRVFKKARYLRELMRSLSRARPTLHDRRVALAGVAQLAWSERRDLVKEMLIPFFRNGRRTALGTIVFRPTHAASDIAHRLRQRTKLKGSTGSRQ
ncbi:MAG: glycosyltransferase [Rhodobacteraceae bacterium]|nr:glycosyltransferase [Paracoccaceae bacterium]